MSKSVSFIIQLQRAAGEAGVKNRPAEPNFAQYVSVRYANLYLLIIYGFFGAFCSESRLADCHVA